MVIRPIVIRVPATGTNLVKRLVELSYCAGPGSRQRLKSMKWARHLWASGGANNLVPEIISGFGPRSVRQLQQPNSFRDTVHCHGDDSASRFIPRAESGRHGISGAPPLFGMFFTTTLPAPTMKSSPMSVPAQFVTRFRTRLAIRLLQGGLQTRVLPIAFPNARTVPANYVNLSRNSIIGRGPIQTLSDWQLPTDAAEKECLNGNHSAESGTRVGEPVQETKQSVSKARFLSAFIIWTHNVSLLLAITCSVLSSSLLISTAPIASALLLQPSPRPLVPLTGSAQNGLIGPTPAHLRQSPPINGAVRSNTCRPPSKMAFENPYKFVGNPTSPRAKPAKPCKGVNGISILDGKALLRCFEGLLACIRRSITFGGLP